MSKVITLIIPTYNMEKYLSRCLSSVLDETIGNEVEVIIVNDGSKDRSLAIARQFEEKRPECVVVIDKQNGNYGSCVNAALPVAKGKYIKILDADDWFDTKGFVQLIRDLSRLDVDMVVTNWRICYTDGKIEEKRIPSSIVYNKVYTDLEFFSMPEYSRLGMHEIVYRTSMLREMDYKQTEGISYTDSEWSFHPLAYVKKVAFSKASVYRYLIGREGQTMDQSVLVRTLNQELKGVEVHIQFLKSLPKEPESVVKAFLEYKLQERIFFIYIKALLLADDEAFNPEVLDKVEELLSTEYPEMLDRIEHIDIRSRIVVKWRKKRERIPSWLRRLIVSNYDGLKSLGRKLRRR